MFDLADITALVSAIDEMDPAAATDDELLAAMAVLIDVRTLLDDALAGLLTGLAPELCRPP